MTAIGSATPTASKPDLRSRYDVEKIQRDCKWFSIDTVRIAMTLYRRLGLIYEEMDGTLVLADHDNLVGSETDWAEKKRRQNASGVVGKISPPLSPALPQPGEETLPIDNRDKRLDIRDQTLETDTEEKKSNNARSSEPVPGSEPPAPEPVISLPLIDGTEYGIIQADIDKYASLYPAVNILQELRAMVGWLDANPKRRKTRGGIKRFINNWLSNEQDSGGTLRTPAAGNNRPSYSYSDNEKPYN